MKAEAPTSGDEPMVKSVRYVKSVINGLATVMLRNALAQVYCAALLINKKPWLKALLLQVESSVKGYLIMVILPDIILTFANFGLMM